MGGVWRARAGYSLSLPGLFVSTTAAVDTGTGILLAAICPNDKKNLSHINLFRTVNELLADTHWSLAWSTPDSILWTDPTRLAFVSTRTRLFLLAFECQVQDERYSRTIRALDATTGEVVTEWAFCAPDDMRISCVVSKGNLVGIGYYALGSPKRRIEVYAVQDTDPPCWTIIAVTPLQPPMWVPNSMQLYFVTGGAGGLLVSDTYGRGDKRVLHWDFEKKLGIRLLDSVQRNRVQRNHEHLWIVRVDEVHRGAVISSFVRDPFLGVEYKLELGDEAILNSTTFSASLGLVVFSSAFRHSQKNTVRVFMTPDHAAMEAMSRERLVWIACVLRSVLQRNR